MRFFWLHLLIVSFSLADISAQLDGGRYSIIGTFGAYDFPDKDINFDWVFTDLSTNTTYQLAGIQPSEENIFGWLEVDVVSPEPLWYMLHLGEDVDGDGNTKFDWLLIATKFDAVYKIDGVTPEGTFEYSEPIAIEYEIYESSLLPSKKSYTIEFFRNTESLIWDSGDWDSGDWN